MSELLVVGKSVINVDAFDLEKQNTLQKRGLAFQECFTERCCIVPMLTQKL
ncbi:MAG: hypothetical protein H6Q41_5706 [Deltaproteobacteria bacterium]|nr:hypothetical protein [Deltaproteobacteria bacterium]